MKKGGKAHVSKEWDSNESSSDSNYEEVTTLAFNKNVLFPQGQPHVPHGKGEKVECISKVVSYVHELW
jgi:beta-galactosidase beta subunit